MTNTSHCLVAVCFASLLFACGGQATDSDSQGASSGGTSSATGGVLGGTGGSVTGGSTSGGAASGGASSGGSNGDGGASTGATGGLTGSGGQSATGGAPPTDCEWDGKTQGTPASTNGSPSDSFCDACLKDVCPFEFAACFATKPESRCGYANGQTWEGAFAKTYECLFDAYNQGVGDFTGSQADIDACLAVHAGGPCTDHATTVTRALIECMAGLPPPGHGADCMYECSLRE